MDNLTPITREEILMNDEPLTPITREEKILAGEDLNPVTRREYFLKKYRHAGGEVMVEGLEVTANGTYTAPEGKAYSPVNVAVPLPDNAYLLKEASGSLVSFDDGADLPMPSFICNITAQQDLHGYDGPWVGGAGKNKLENKLTTRTYNGVTATVKEDGTVTLTGTATTATNFFINTELNLTGNYIISGCPSGGSENSYYMNALIGSWGAKGKDTGNGIYSDGGTITNVAITVANGYSFPSGGITFTPMIESGSTKTSFAPYSNICPISGHTGVNAWVRGKNLMSSEWELGSYGAGGLPSSDDNKIRTKTMISCMPNKSYAVSFTTSKSNVWVYYYEKDGSFIGRADISNTMNFSTPDNCELINFRCDKDSEGVNVSCMLVFGDTFTTYELYNSNSQTISVSWQTEAGEVFGGYIDLVSGELTVTDGYIASYNGETLPSTWISDRDVYTEGTSPTTGAEVVYKLANPQTYQLTPTQIKSLLGYNNAWCSTGNIDIDYFAKEV